MSRDFFWSIHSVRRSLALLFLGLTLTLAVARADDEPFQVEVNILSATVKSGETSIATVRRGTTLVAHEFNGSYYLIDLPNANPPQQGWIAKDDVHRVVDELAEMLERRDALPAEQREEDAKRSLTESAKLDAWGANLNQLFHEGRTDDAYKLAQQITRDTKTLLGMNNHFYAVALSNLGLVERDRGNFVVARDDIAAGLAIYRVLYGDKSADVATALNNLGDVAFHAGDYPTAKKYHEQALAIRLEVFGEKGADVAMSFQNLGCLAIQAGDYAKARALFEKTLALNREALGDNDPKIAISLDNLGTAAAESGDFATAAADYKRALAIQAKAFTLVHAETVATLINLGRLSKQMGDYDLAKKYFTGALESERQLRGEKHPDVAYLLYSLGVVAEYTGDHPAARKYFEEALAIRRAVLGDKHFDTAVTLGGLGSVAAHQGDFKTALQFYEQALDRYRLAVGEMNPHVASVQVDIAIVEAEAGDWGAATESMQQARRITRRYVARTLAGLSEKDQLTFLQMTHTPGLYCALSLGVARHDDQRLAVASAGWLLNGKAVAEEALSARTRLVRNANSPAAAQLSERLISVRGQLATLSLQAGAAAAQDARQAELAALTDEEQSLSRQLGTMGADVEQADPWVSLDDLRRNLSDDAVLLDFARLPLRDFGMHGNDGEWKEPHYAAWLIPPTGKGEIEVVDLGSAAPIETAIQNVRNAIQARRGIAELKGIQLTDAPTENGDPWQPSVAALAKQVWRPLESRVKRFHEVILCPDAALWLVPWAALPSGDGKHFVLEDWQIRYVTSARDIAEGNTRRANTGAAIIADPDYNLSPQAAIASTEAIFGESQRPPQKPTPATTTVPIGDLAQLSPGVRSSGRLGSAMRLPGTAKEAAAIRPALAKYVGEEPQVYLDHRALEGVVKKLNRPRVLVLSTHGFFFPDQQAKGENHADGSNDRSTAALDTNNKPIENPLLRCGLLFAGCNHRDELAAAGTDDGVLTGLEIVGCDLRGTELVVLSACDTGLGDVHNGEGVAGLRQAFQLAGARAVVASLWQVPDAETSQLMSDFFANLAAGQSKADALNAQLKAIRTRRERYGTAHPFFWAAFTLTGQ